MGFGFIGLRDGSTSLERSELVHGTNDVSFPHSAFDGWAWAELWRNMAESGVRYQYHEK
jgi:hypothetical protein